MIDAPYVVVQQVPVWRMIGPYFWVRYERWDCILGFSWPDNRVQSLFHLCAVFLCSTYLYKTSQNCPTTHYSKQHCPVSPEECATFPLLLKSHHIWRKLCMHDCWNVFRVSAWSYGIPSVNILVLIKVFSHKKNKVFQLLMFQLAQQALCTDQTVIFCHCRHELASPHQIWLVSKAIIPNCSDRVPWKLELLSKRFSAYLYKFQYSDGIKTVSKRFAFGYNYRISVSAFLCELWKQATVQLSSSEPFCKSLLLCI